MKTHQVLLVLAASAMLLLFGTPNLITSNAALDTAGTNPISNSTSRLQFTSLGHALGFGKRDWVLSNGTYALHVELLGAHSVAPVSSTAARDQKQAAPLERVMYWNLWDGITLTYCAPGERADLSKVCIVLSRMQM